MSGSIFTRRGFLGLAAAATAAVALSACGSQEATPQATASGGASSVALLVFDSTNPFVAALVAGAQKTADGLGIDLTVANGNYDNATQIAQVQDAIAKKASAIVIQAADADGIVPAIKQANKANIPVFAVNANVGEGADVVSFVGADQSEMGAGAAKLVKEARPDGAKIALIQGVVGNPIVTVRTDGFTKALAGDDAYPIVATVTDKFTSDGNLAAVQDLLAKYPKGQLDAIVAQGGQLYVGAKYAASHGRTDIAFIANDYPEQIEAGIKSGEIYGTVNQDPTLQGSAVIEAVHNWLTGAQDKVQRPTQYLELPLVTKANVAEYQSSWRS